MKRATPTLPAPVQAAWTWVRPALAAGLYFLAVCLCSSATIRQTAVLLILLVLSSVFLFYARLRSRISPPILALGLVVLMDGLSLFYAVSGKLALLEFLKVLAGFCLSLVLLAFAGGREPGRRAAAVLEGCCAVAGLVSVDLLSTRFISGPVLALVGQFTPDYAQLTAVEEGVRITSVFMSPNVFAGCMGIGVLLSLGLAVSAPGAAARRAHLVCLFICALSFLLAFSLGACMAIAPAFLVLVLLERRERRAELLLVMAQTLILTMLAAFPISRTSLTAWEGVRPIPLLCLAAGAAALCGADRLGRRAAAWLNDHRRTAVRLVCAALACLAVYAAAACCWTGGVTLQPGSSLRRAAYPQPGYWTMTWEAGGDPSVVIESQNRADTMMHTSTELYRGPLSQAAFTVPEDSLVVYFTFTAGETVRLEAAGFTGEGGSGSLPLGYRLLPDFAANRLQGLLANQNAIQRLVFFEDGLKLFRRSPLIGLGLGAFENARRSVQPFCYVTRYVHNHYIQTLLETGMAGFVLLLGLFAVPAAAVWRGRRQGEALAPALGAALVFMAGHAMVEVVFSYYAYLPIAFGVFAVISLCCPLPAPFLEKRGVRGGLLLGASALLVVFGILLNCNMIARSMAQDTEDLSVLSRAAQLDRFEWAEYMLAYVDHAAQQDVTPEERRQADAYADRLSQLDSNTVPLHLAGYYLRTGRLEQGLAMAEKYVRYTASDSACWQRAFGLLSMYETEDPLFREAVVHMAELMETWNEEHMGEIVLDENAAALIARMRS